LAAGRGERAGGSRPKQYTTIGHVAVIRRTAEAFLSHGEIDPVVLVVNPDDHALCMQVLGDIAARIALVTGGATRQDSTFAGLQYLQQFAPDYVHIHDGARPFITHVQLDAIHHALTPEGGILLALSVSDTLKQADGDRCIVATVPRTGLFAAQTPQSFPYPLILAAHEAAVAAGRHDFTDDSSIAEWHNIPMRILEGSPDNLKITWAGDIERADRHFWTYNNLFPDVRTGNGYDAHKLVQGDGITLCGIKISCDKKLSGHSDADVALHALTDALLATRGAGDIGTHFPPSDPQWKGAASEIFVRHAIHLIREKNGRITNVDITVIAEAPRISPYREAMTRSLQSMLGIAPERISVKATTNETLGFIGREEGIAAIATATVIYSGG